MKRAPEGTISVTTRVRVTELVAALGVVEKLGVTPYTRSEIVARCVEIVARMVDEEEWLDSLQAVYLLDSRYPVKTRKGFNVVTNRSSEEFKAFIAEKELRYNILQGRTSGRSYLKTPGGIMAMKEGYENSPNARLMVAEEVGRNEMAQQLEQAQVGQTQDEPVQRKQLNYEEIISGGNHYLVCKDEETYKEVVGKFGSVEIAKQAGYTVLREDEFDPIARRAKSEVSQEVPQEVLKSLGDMVVVGSESQPKEAHK